MRKIDKYPSFSLTSDCWLDVCAIMYCAANMGYVVEPLEAYWFWLDYSDRRSANWLDLPADHNELWRAIINNIPITHANNS